MQDQDIVREFLVESHENLARLDQELIELEKQPKDAALLASIFRTFHTIKGTCGFLAFSTLEALTHQAEGLLSQLRDGKRELNAGLVSLILETVDATRKMLAAIERNGKEGPERFEDLTARLRLAARLDQCVESPAVATGPSRSDAGPAASPACAESAAARMPGQDPVRPSALADANIRVGVGLLDKLMDLVGELVLTRNQILQFNAEREDATLNATAQRLNLITAELQEGVMKTRMQPVGTVWSKLPRVVRDIAVALGKQIRLDLDGAETELDRTIIEAIKDPLIHLVRNCCDHGIERPDVRTGSGKPPQGRLSLRAYHEGGQVNIEIGDDGAGIDVARVKKKAVEKGLLRPEEAARLSEREALNLIFEPGFSTARAVTSVSGRGVGMDVVKSNIEKIGGVVDVISRPGEGTTVKLKIPLTLAIIPGLVVTSGGERFVIPQVSLLELIRLESDSGERRIESVHGTPVYRRRGRLLPVTDLNRVLGLKPADRDDALSMVVLQAGERQFGLVVDAINDTQEIVVKPLGRQFKGLTVYAGATILGDGRVALILDVAGIGERSGVLTQSREQTRAADEEQPQLGVEQQRLLMFRVGSFERMAVPLSLVARLEEFPRSRIERAGGCDVVQYRDHILPLIPLQSVLEPEWRPREQDSDPVQVVVFSDRDRSVGLVVDQILDIAEEVVTARQKSGRKGLLGSAVVGQRVSDFLDLGYVVQAAAPDWFLGRSSPAHGKQVLVAETSPFSRGLMRNGLEMAGYQVIEAADVHEAVLRLEQNAVSVVVAALDLPPRGSRELFETMRRSPEWRAIPAVALADSTEEAKLLARRPAGFQDCQVRSNPTGTIESVMRLASALASAEAEQPVHAGREIG